MIPDEYDYDEDDLFDDDGYLDDDEVDLLGYNGIAGEADDGPSPPLYIRGMIV